ncbi:MAG: GFA family protein [Gammaproteobacteria bacterium]|nr:GFA family protein [Gammaproteobacteria bacterium]MDH5777408.1 GFA family protein [Gammaproteobacteria bacterium]
MYQGGCLCGAVRFQISGEIRNIIYCHCSQCRKAQGSAFATNGIVEADKFVFQSGEEALTGYESTPGQTKYFCQHCGSPIISRQAAKPDQVRVRLGTVESAISERPMAHIFTASKANWEVLCGELPQFEEYEGGR